MYSLVSWKNEQYLFFIIIFLILLGDFQDNDSNNFLGFLSTISGSLSLTGFYLVGLLRKCDTVLWNKPEYFKVFAISKLHFFTYQLRQVFLFKNFLVLLLVVAIYILTKYVWLESHNLMQSIVLTIVYIGNVLFVVILIVLLKNLCKGQINSDKNHIILTFVPFILFLSVFSKQMQAKGDTFSLFILHYNPFSNIFYWGLQDANGLVWYIALYPFIGVAVVFLCAKLFLKQWI